MRIGFETTMNACDAAELEDPSGLQATLRADGARVVVTASLAWPAVCGE
jgi:hypothetical protein